MLSALRVPARWSLVGGLGLALAACAGASRLSPPALGAVIALALVEAVHAPLPVSRVPHDGEPPPVYRFLASARRGPVIEFPLASSIAEQMEVEPQRVYWSTVHWQPLVNGYSGYAPPTYRELAGIFAAGPTPEALGVLTSWGVTTVVVHDDELSEAQRPLWGGTQGRLAQIYRDDATRVFALEGSAPPFARRRAALAGAQAVSPRARHSLPLAIEAGPLEAVPPPWIGWHTARATWRKNGEIFSRWARYDCTPTLPSTLKPNPLFVEGPPVPGAYRLELDALCLEIAGEVIVR